MTRFIIFYVSPTARVFAMLLVSALVALVLANGAIALPNT